MSDQIEVADRQLFDEIADSYVKKDLTPYCMVARKQRLDTSLTGLARPISSMLEVGCGAGFTAEYLRDDFSSYVGVDYSENLIRYAEEKNGRDGVRFVTTNVKDFEGGERFTVILMVGVLHHIPEPGQVVHMLRDLLEPDGIIVVNEPQSGNPAVGLLRKVRKRVDPKYSADQVEFSESELRELFEQNGYDVRTFPQGVLSTPLAETRFLPNLIGMPLAILARALDPMLEKLLRFLGLNRLAWNIVIHAHPQTAPDRPPREKGV